MGCGMSTPRQRYDMRHALHNKTSGSRRSQSYNKLSPDNSAANEQMPAWAQAAKEELYREQQEPPPPFNPKLRYQGPPYKGTPNGFQHVFGTG